LPIRQPSYLDHDLLENIADYLGVGYPVEESIRELGSRERSGELGASIPGVSVGVRGRRAGSDEIERTYASPVRPVKVFNDVLDKALLTNEAKDLTGQEADWSAVRRELVLIEGEAAQSSITGVGTLLATLLPAMAPTLAQDTPGMPTEFIAQLLGGASTARPLLFELVPADAPVRVMLQLDGGKFHRDATPDEVTGEVSVFGVVDQLVPEGSFLDLSRFLLPGVNRVARRAIDEKSIRDLLAKLGQPDAELAVDGPVWLVKPIGVF